MVPLDKMRFALTCRHIRPEKIDPSLHHMGDYDASLLEDYHGDVEETEATAMVGGLTLT